MKKDNIKGNSLSKRSIQKLISNKKSLVGLIMLVVITVLCFGAPLFTNQDPLAIDIALKFAPPSSEHLLGCDSTGRDLWSRLLYGGRMSIIIGMGGAFLAAVIGTILGSIAGYYGGRLDSAILYLTEITQSFPQQLLILVVMALAGEGVKVMILIFALTGWTSSIRLVRSRVASLIKEPYVDSCRVNGVRDVAIIIKHLLPNMLGVIILNFTLNVGSYVLTEAALSFLGVGVPKGIPTWGNILNAARSLSVMQSHPLLWLAPGFMISILVLGINFVGDGLRDVYDVTQ